MQLKDKTFIITGAARIGQDIAKYLHGQGANLVISYFIDPAETGPYGVGVKADVSKKEDVQKLIDAAKKEFGRLDGVIHMAAIYQKSPWESLSEKDWDKNMNVIAKSAFLIGKMAGDEMLKNKDEVKGKIIFFSDWSVLARPYTEYSAYNVAKAAINGITMSFAKELAPHVLVNAIAPGPILRPADLTEEENTEVLSHTLVKRWGGPEAITRGVAYLLDSDFTTGTILTIDGGRTIA